MKLYIHQLPAAPIKPNNLHSTPKHRVFDSHLKSIPLPIDSHSTPIDTQKIAKSLKYIENKKYAVKRPFSAQNPLFYWLCSLLRRVCVIFGPYGPKSGSPSWFLTPPYPSPHRSGGHISGRKSPIFAAALSVLLLLGFVSVPFPVQSQSAEWSSSLGEVSWRTRASFVETLSAPVTSRAVPLAGTRKLDQLLSIIALAEADNGYDSVQHGARIRPPSAPTLMTLAQIFDWIERTPRQPHAIGRYQFIPSTLRDLTSRLGVSHSAKFDRGLQDRLALALVAQAGYAEFNAGKLSASAFMDNLALIWAGLPQANGKSAYHGYAGNKATISRARFETLFAGVFG